MSKKIEKNLNYFLENLKFLRALIFANRLFPKISRAKDFANSRNLMLAKINPLKVLHKTILNST